MSLRRYTRAVPFNYTDYGMYALGVTSGIQPATPLSAGEIFQFRWNPANTAILAIVSHVAISAAVSTTYFAAGVPVHIYATKSTAWTVAGTVGTAITPAATTKRRASMASTALVAGDARIAGTDATGLGAGTKTLEANSFASVVSGAPITASLSGQIFAPGTILVDADVNKGRHPLVFTNATAAEGFSILATAPATGTWRVSVNVEWAESTAYPYGTSA